MKTKPSFFAEKGYLGLDLEIGVVEDQHNLLSTKTLSHRSQNKKACFSG